MHAPRADLDLTERGVKRGTARDLGAQPLEAVGLLIL